MNNDFQNFLQQLKESANTVNERLNNYRNDPKNKNIILGWQHYIDNQDKTDPLIENLLSEMEDNENLSEALKILTFSDMYQLIFNQGQIQQTSVLNILNSESFQEKFLTYFNEINLGTHFSERKPFIEEALKLYKLKLFSGCLCLLFSQLEGILTDYLLNKKIIEESIDKHGKPCFVENNEKAKAVNGLYSKIQLAKDTNIDFYNSIKYKIDEKEKTNLSRLSTYKVDSKEKTNLSDARNQILHGSNIKSFTEERCFIVFIWTLSILNAIYKEQLLNSLSIQRNKGL